MASDDPSKTDDVWMRATVVALEAEVERLAQERDDARDLLCKIAKAAGWSPLRAWESTGLAASVEKQRRERDEALAEAAKWREAAKVKTVRTITRPVPRFEPEGSDEE